MRQWRDVATLVKPKNLNGRFVARPAAGLPFVLREGMRVVFVPPQLDLPREGAVDYLNAVDATSWEIGFDTVGDGAMAQGLVGCHCLVKREDVESAFADDETVLWVGWQVVDAVGAPIGDVSAMIQNPAHPLLEVERADGSGRTLIPVVDAFIVSVNEEGRAIVVDLPEGLLDL